MRPRAGLMSSMVLLLLLSADVAAAAVESRAVMRRTQTASIAMSTMPDLGRRSGATCQRWRRLAARLGETYAGHQLRAAVAARQCAFAEDRGDEDVWGWPWRHPDVRADLPPLRHGRYGAWEIRCEAGRRRRCALALETVMADSLDPEARSLRLVAHVVIDSVAGRESVLWRVHVTKAVAIPEAAGGVSWQMADRHASESFDACGRSGCLAEADPRQSAEVATWLWSGRPLPVALGRGADGTDMTSVLPAHGFRAGLSELIRLRRQEVRALAGR